MAKVFTSIPTNGIYVTPMEYPRGWQVARYDHEGLASDLRWFSSLAKAAEYAKTLEAKHG